MSTTAILVTNYNNGPWLRACLDSALAQTRPADEIIVYDDGSTDESRSILASYGDRIRVLLGDKVAGRSGIASQGAGVEATFAVCSAEHIYLLDGDDVFLPEKIERYEAAWAKRPEAAMVQAPTELIDEHGRLERSAYERLKHPKDGDFRAATYRTQDTDLYYSTSALAFSRCYLEKRFPLNYGDGIALPVDNRLASAAPFFGPVICLETTLSQWRQRSNSISRNDAQRDPLGGTLRRYRHFNLCAAQYGFAPIRLWKNRRYWRQLARRVAPNWLSAPFVRNPAGESPEK